MSFGIEMFDGLDVSGLFTGDASPLADIDITPDELTNLNDTFTEGLGEKFDDGFLSSDDIDGQLAKFWGNEKFSGVSAEDRNTINAEIKDQIWEKAGAENTTTGADIQAKEYQQRLEALGKEFGDDKQELDISSLDEELQAELEELGIKSDATLTKNEYESFKTDIANKLKIAKEKGFGDIGGEDGIDGDELAVLDVNQDGKIDFKDGDFETGKGEEGIINEKDEAIDARTEEAKDKNKTDINKDKTILGKDKKDQSMAKIMKVLQEVIAMVAKMQQQNKAKQQRQQAPVPAARGQGGDSIAARNNRVNEINANAYYAIKKVRNTPNPYA